jgi:hypothetical protein
MQSTACAFFFRKCLPNGRNLCFINSTLQLLASSIWVHVAFEVLKCPSGRILLWKSVIQSIRNATPFHSTDISSSEKFDHGQLASEIENSIPGHSIGSQNCALLVLNYFFADVRGISKHFELETEIGNWCTVCKNKSVLRNKCVLMPLQVQNNMSIQDAIALKTRKQLICGHSCTCCGCPGNIHIHQMKILSAPRALIINVQKEAESKIGSPLAPIRVSPDSRGIYRLRGVIGYSGNGDAGHYWNYITCGFLPQFISDSRSRLGTYCDIESVTKDGVLFLYEQIPPYGICELAGSRKIDSLQVLCFPTHLSTLGAILPVLF